MLNPNSREIYLDELRAPVGYQLDQALATTFSLDLLTLLMAPLSMALNDCRDRKTALKDPIAVMEALKATAGRLIVFCEEGRIQVPRKDQTLFRYLEPMVVQVHPPAEEGVFHAKTWLMRFTPEDPAEPIRYRFLCLSRNLTFDRSWDTVLTLDGEMTDRETAIAANRPLADFLDSLPKLATVSVPAEWRQAVEKMSKEVLRVRFEPPEGFDGKIRFRPIGIDGHNKPPKIKGCSRVLIVSPFLSDETVEVMASEGKNNVLVSRLESLDALRVKTIERLQENAELWVMDDAVEPPEEASSDSNSGPEPSVESTPPAEPTELSGLHAKLYIVEDRGDATVFTGSANATTAGLEGTNVEFLVEMDGRRRDVGVDAFLGDGDEQSFRSLLSPYPGKSKADPEESVRRKLQRKLELARRAIAKAVLSLTIAPMEDGTFGLHLQVGKEMPWPKDVTGRCYPISLQETAAKDLPELSAGAEVLFERVSLLALTGFIAFRLHAQADGLKESIEFVLNLPVVGMPEDRDKRIVQDIISDSGRFLRYLMLILSGEEILGEDPVPPTGAVPGNGSTSSHEVEATMPLLEELIRAFSRYPDKIDRIARLVGDIRQSSDPDKLLPSGFLQIWDVLMAAKSQGSSV